jgi:uncharacterized lipoprotein YajG
MTNLKGILKILLQTGILMNLLSKGMKLGKAASDVKIDIKLSNHTVNVKQIIVVIIVCNC